MNDIIIPTGGLPPTVVIPLLAPKNSGPVLVPAPGIVKGSKPTLSTDKDKRRVGRGSENATIIKPRG